jgi:putative oxidoreductase
MMLKLPGLERPCKNTRELRYPFTSIQTKSRSFAMKWAALIARVLVGLPFLVLGLDHFVKFLTMPSPPELPENAMKFISALGSTGYLDVVKLLEVVGGALVLSGRMTPLGLVLATPVAVNIALFDVFLARQPGLGVVLVALCLFLVWAYRSHFAAVFSTNAKIG